MQLKFKPSVIEPGSIEWKKCKGHALIQIGSKAKDLLNAENVLEDAEESVERAAEELMIWKGVLKMMEAMESGYGNLAIEWPEPELPFVKLSVTEKKD